MNGRNSVAPLLKIIFVEIFGFDIHLLNWIT